MQFSSRWRSSLPSVAAVILSLFLPLTLPLVAVAQDDGITSPQPSDDAPVSSAVARIDALSGDVAIQRGDSNDTVAAVANAPILGADYVTTGQDGRAEVGFDGRSAVRLGENVQMRFTSVDPANRQMQLAAGTVDLRLFGDTDGQSAIDTPSISIVPRTAGSFRVSVDNNGETAVTVRSGRADIVTPQGTQSLEPGTTLIADGAAANPEIQTQPALALDNFDNYNGDRDRIYLAATSEGQYVNTGIQGVGDLAGNGQWVDDGTYGHVWMPTVESSDWAPYRDGSWAWEDGYGWTWVAAEPWGWAPYHYGRWYFSSAYHRWAWYPPAPGRYAPAWSPALVGFVGFNIGSVNAGLGFGNIGWVPLAPFEAFHPWWGPHATSFGIAANFGNTYVNAHYRNIAVANAMTSVTRENFQAGRFGHPYVVSQEELHTLRPVAVQGALPIAPTHANFRFTQRNVSPALAARSAFTNRSFAGRPAIATRVAYRPAFSTAGNESWQRFNSNRAPDAGYRSPQSFARPAYAQPQYNRQYAQPQYNRQTSPEYNRQYSQPQYNRQYAQPQYNRQTSPGYARQAAPSYNRPAASAHSAPAARATREGDRRDR